jgi:hypothetical protein
MPESKPKPAPKPKPKPAPEPEPNIAQKGAAFVGNYPASTLTPVVAAALYWAQQQPQWHWDKADKQFAATLLALTPAIITLVSQKGKAFILWVVSLFRKDSDEE